MAGLEFRRGSFDSTIQEEVPEDKGKSLQWLFPLGSFYVQDAANSYDRPGVLLFSPFIVGFIRNKLAKRATNTIVAIAAFPLVVVLIMIPNYLAWFAEETWRVLPCEIAEVESLLVKVIIWNEWENSCEM